MPGTPFSVALEADWYRVQQESTDSINDVPPTLSKWTPSVLIRAAGDDDLTDLVSVRLTGGQVSEVMDGTSRKMSPS